MIQYLQFLIIAAAVGGLLYVFLRPHWVFVLVIVLWPMEQLLQVYVPFFSAHREWFNYIIAGIAVVAVGLRIARKEAIVSGIRNPVTTCVTLLYLLWTAGLLYTPAIEEALLYFWTGLPYLLLLLVFFPLLVLDIFEFRTMLTGLMLLGSTIAVLIMINPHSSFIGGRLFLDLGMLSGRDQYGSPLALGEMGGLIALTAALVKPPRPNQLYTLIRIAAFVAGFGLAIGSGSRGQVLAAGICGVLFYPMARRLSNPKQFFINVIGFAVLCAGIYLVFLMFVSHQNRARWDIILMLKDTTGRLEMVWQLFEAYLASPAYWLFGLGTSAYAYVGGQGGYVHNVAAEILCQHGLVGATLFIVIIITTIKYGQGLWMLYRDDASMRATVALLLAICGYALLLSLKQGSISYPAPFFWWMVLAKLYAHEKRVLALSGVPEHKPHEDEHTEITDKGYVLGY